MGVRHDASASAQILSNNFANLTTNFSLREYWYPETVRKEWDPEEERVTQRMESGFETGRDFSTSISANTTIYGMSGARIGKYEGFRHTMRPSLSLSYSPDFSDPFWGYFREVQSSADGRTQEYSIFEGGIAGGPSPGEQRTMSFNLSNVLETKEVHRDSTGERSERNVRLIDQLNASLSYNFAADQFNLSDLSTSFRTSYFENLSLSARANFSFYDTDDEGFRIDQYLWEDAGRFMRMTNFSVTASSDFSGGGGGRQPQASWDYPEHYDPLDQSVFHPVDRALREGRVQPMDVPWSFRVNFNYRWNRTPGGGSRKSAQIEARNIQFRLTPQWQVNTRIGYDLVDGELTPARFNVTRNLHCWNLSFQWNPFDDMKFFLFRLTVNDSQLQGLFQKLPGLNNLERRSGPISRFPR